MAKQGTRFRFRRLMFWAEDGMICIEDLMTGEFDVVMVREMLLRTRAINDEIRRFKHADERNEHQNFVDDAIKACRQAKAQGRPDDPKAVADAIRHRRVNVFYMGGGSTTSDCASAQNMPEGDKLPAILGPDGQPFFRKPTGRKLIV